MPNELIERIAGTIWTAWRGPEEWGGAWAKVSDRSRSTGLAMGRAAILALREPTEAMIAAGYAAEVNGQATAGIWRAMIDAALRDDPPAPAP